MRNVLAAGLLTCAVYGLGVVAGSFMSPALGYNYDPWCTATPSSSFGYNFAGTGWDNDFKSWFNAGALEWEEILDPTGEPYIEISGTSTPIYLVDLGAGYGGLTTCQSGSVTKIEIDPYFGLDTAAEAKFTGISMHEVGHALGMTHVGPNDSHDGETATMTAGCGLDHIGGHMEDWFPMKQDDQGRIASFHNDHIHADASFEGNFDVWNTGTGGTLQFITSSSGASVGSERAKLTGGYAAFVEQDMRITNPNESGLGFIAKVRTREAAANSDGYMVLKMYSREIDYDTTGDSCISQYPLGWDFNEPTLVYSYYTLEDSKQYNITTDWVQRKTDPAWTEPEDDNWDGVDIRVRLAKYVHVGGTAKGVNIDMLRVEMDS